MIAPELAEPQPVDGTATSAVSQGVIVQIPETMTTLVNRVAGLRDKVQALGDGVSELHHQVNASDLERRTHFKVRAGIVALLNELAVERGMSWSDLAFAMGVSVQAVRKWRKGESATGENRFALARLAAFIDLLSQLNIDDPVSWLEVPLVSGYSMRGLDLYAAGRIDLLLEWADARIPSPERLLDEADSDWRSKYRLSYETFEAGDGHLSIRRRK